jgi:hypothetical protein
MESRKKILDKAKKLKELAERGIGGEKENAKAMLEKYMIKHEISDAEIYSYKPSSDSDYSKMTDDQFLQLIIIEFIPVGISALFSKFGNDEYKAKANLDAMVFFKKFLNIISDRTNKKN